MRSPCTVCAHSTSARAFFFHPLYIFVIAKRLCAVFAFGMLIVVAGCGGSGAGATEPLHLCQTLSFALIAPYARSCFAITHSFVRFCRCNSDSSPTDNPAEFTGEHIYEILNRQLI